MTDAWERDKHRLMDAVERAEGGPDALVRAVKCSIPSVGSYDEARRILLRSLDHMLWDYATRDLTDFVRTWARRWAPEGVSNDPLSLNRHWPANVLAIYLGTRDRSPR